MIYRLLLLLAFLTPVSAQSLLAPAQISPNQGTPATGAQGREGAFYKEQLWMIPFKGEAGRRLAVMLYKGGAVNQQRPLVVITHGTEANEKANKSWKLGMHPHVIEWWIERGFHVAVVHRRGYGLTGGKRSEGFSCDLPQHALAGDNAAQDLISVIEYLTKEPMIKNTGVIAVGQSTGGWSIVGLAARNHPQVKAVINFSGGRRGISGQTKQACGFDELSRDASLFGMKAKTPSLWIYTKNDQTFSVNVINRLHTAYKAGGAPLEFHLLDDFGKDGHSLMPSPNGIPRWGSVVKNFIEK